MVLTNRLQDGRETGVGSGDVIVVSLIGIVDVVGDDSQIGSCADSAN
jgi:hypothetical protein